MTGEQLTLFEPSGEELALLAEKHLRDARRKEACASVLAIQGLSASAAAYMRQSWAALDSAVTCESAFQFERLAGLS